MRKIPQRMCSGCGEMKPKKEMIRVVRSPDGEVSIDLTGKKAWEDQNNALELRPELEKMNLAAFDEGLPLGAGIVVDGLKRG